ncbi:hypothetical protein MNBD_GAMMA25-1167, partial [hydrothermal vent metagenome]
HGFDTAGEQAELNGIHNRKCNLSAIWPLAKQKFNLIKTLGYSASTV